MREGFDVVVVGAGSTGSTTAYYLAREGFRVLVVDSRGVAQGMTAYSLGLVRSYYTNEDVARMSHYSHEFFMNFSKEFGVNVFTKTGLLVIGNNEANMRAIHDMLRKIGARVRLIGGGEIRELLDAEVMDGELGIYEEDAGYADTGLYTNTIMRRAMELGVEFVIDDDVRALIKNNEVRGIELVKSHDTIRAEHYVIATGVWTPKVLPQLNLPIRNIIERIVRVDTGRPLPNVFDYVNNFYIRPEGSSNALMGLLYPPEDVWQDPDTFNPLAPPSLDYSLDVMERAAKRFRWFEGARLMGGWQGLYDVTPDWMPIIDEPIKKLILCVGLSGHGFKLAPAFALMITEMIKYGESRTFRNTFALDRFRMGRLIRGVNEVAAF